MTTPLDRRRLFKLIAAATLSSAAQPLLGLQETAVAEGLPGLPGVEAKALLDLAKAYGELGEDQELAAMVRRLEARSLEDDDLVAELRQEMRDDFAEGRVVELYGWHLSRTEGRLFAAASRLLAREP